LSRPIVVLLLLALAIGLVYGRFGVPFLLPRADDAEYGQQSLPPGWRIEEIARGAHPFATPEDTHVLAWQRHETVERCLVLCQIRTGHRGYWALALVFRSADGWEVAMVPKDDDEKDTWARHCQCSERCPSNKDIYDFIAKVGFDLRDAMVCRLTWQAIVGEAPTRK
jgi:hypothetical protein